MEVKQICAVAWGICQNRQHHGAKGPICTPEMQVYCARHSHHIYHLTYHPCPMIRHIPRLSLAQTAHDHCPFTTADTAPIYLAAATCKQWNP
jgi:hypothetical protein